MQESGPLQTVESQPSGSSLGRTLLGRLNFTLLVVFFCLTCAQAELHPILSHGSPQEVGMSMERLMRVERVIEKAIENQETPGAVLMVARKGKVVYQKAFGHRSLKPSPQPMTLDTIFDMASLTKVIATATSIMILVENGEIALTDPVSLYLPDFSENEKDSITILQMLTHYSGLRPDLDLDQLWEGYETAIRLGFQEETVAMPGERFIYSDINFFLASEIIRAVSGMSLDEFSRKHIFEPLGMLHTRFNPPRDWVPRIAPTEWRDEVMLQGKVHDPTAARMGGIAGHAGLFSTVGDTAIYAQMILNRGVYNRIRILAPLTVDRMTENQSPFGEARWRGLGFDIWTRFSTPRGDLFPVGSFGHTGFTGTSLWIDRSTQTFVVLFANRLHPDGSGDVASLRKKIASVVAASILETDEIGQE